ncbi:MAG TPA: glycosyltransferase N-terminal domain-containing protein [Myxococcota bacterium]|nr:glycosyltransferase N-terminal domain-containing protein [Myxococcota bacterium]
MGPLGHSLAALSAAAGLPLGLAALAAKPGWRPGLGERLGARPTATPGCVWIHGASVGEVRAALRLLDAFAARGTAVAASASTIAGRDLLRRERPAIPSGLAPLDHPWSVERAFRRTPAALLALVETELWPSWIRGAREHGAACAIVSGRLSDRSFPRYRRARALLRPTLCRLAAIGARSPLDAERFAALGAPAERIEVTGDLKLDPPASPPALAPDLAAALGAVPLIVAGSTHAGEEEAALGALAAAREAGLPAALALAPRHADRFDDVAALVAARGLPLQRRSRGAPRPLAAGDVLLVDTIGELAALYGAAAVGFVGGTLAPRGGHSVVEPAQAGRAPLFGPSTENTRDAADLLLARGGARRVADAAELAAAVVEALRDPAAAAARGERARDALAPHRGATARTIALLERVLAASRAREAR